MAGLIELDGIAFGAGHALRAALSLSAATGQGFQMHKVRASDPRPGLRPEQTAAVRAAALCCDAQVSGVFDGSPELRFEPRAAVMGEYHFELPGPACAPQVAQMALPILAGAPGASTLTVVGGTHVPGAPVHEHVAYAWLGTLADAGLRATCAIERVGFHPEGGGRVRARVEGWQREARLDLTRRGALLGLRGVSLGTRLKGEVARRQRAGCDAHLWEQRRLEVAWDPGSVPVASPGAALFVEARFEHTRAGFTLLGRRGLSPEALGERLARALLRFLDDDSQAGVDAQLADQLAVPLALLRGGGALTTPQVTPALVRQAELLRAFGVGARAWGRLGGPGGLEVAAC